MEENKLREELREERREREKGGLPAHSAFLTFPRITY
jgi:hypothetical protein